MDRPEAVLGQLFTSPKMRTLSPNPRWPFYEKRCCDWVTAIRKINGEFRRDGFGNGALVFLIGMCAGTSAWVIYAASVGPERFDGPPWNWLVPALAATFLALAVFLGKRRLGVRYRFVHGEVIEVSARGQVRWREPLVTLQAVDFPNTGISHRGPPVLTLHWSTHHRTIELFPSIEAAVAEVLRASRPVPPERPELSWRCAHCKEANPETFEVCWQCGNAPAR